MNDEELETIRKFAEQGDPEAQYKLGMHYKSIGNLISSLDWLKRANMQGYQEAYYALQDTLDELNREYEEKLAQIPECLRYLVK